MTTKTGKLMKLLFLFKQKLNICQQGGSCEEMKLKEPTGVPGLRVCSGCWRWGGARIPFRFIAEDLNFKNQRQ